MFKKKMNLLLMLVLVVSLLATGCQSNSPEQTETKETKEPIETTKEQDAEQTETQVQAKPVEGGTMIFGVSSDARVMHPLYGNDRTTLTLINHLFSPLFILKGEEVDYWLADSVTPSDDYLSYDLTLKNNLTWHDGEALNADDLVFTFETIMDEKQGSHLKSGFTTSAGPVSLEKIDDLTVRFTLPEVQVGFLDTIGGIRMFPQHVYGGIENIQISDVNANPVGSGPFKFVNKVDGETITLAKFENFFKGPAHLDQVVYRIIPDAATAEIAFKNGEVDAIKIGAEDVQSLEEDAEILAFDEDRVGYILMNQNKDQMKNTQLRQAIAYAVDREEVIKAGYLSTDYAKPAYSFLADKALYKTDDVEHYAYNPEMAKQLLEEAGLTDVTLTLAYIGKDDVNELLVQQYLEAVGIHVELKAMDMASFYNALFDPKHNQEYDLAFNGYIYGKEPSAYAQIFESDNMNNVNNYSNTDADKLWGLAAKETDPQKRKELYVEIQKMIMADVPMYPISYGYAIVAVNPKFQGLEEAEPAPIHMFNDLSQIYMVE